jgi:hypothetical protein
MPIREESHVKSKLFMSAAIRNFSLGENSRFKCADIRPVVQVERFDQSPAKVTLVTLTVRTVRFEAERVEN